MKVYIHPRVTGSDRERLEQLLKSIGCQIVDDLEDCDFQLGVPEDGVECDTDQLPPACVVVLVPGTTDEDLEPVLSQAVGRGCRVIGIWGPGSDGDASALKDYGSDTVVWDSESIRDAICGKPRHQNPDGTPAPQPKPTTGGC